MKYREHQKEGDLFSFIEHREKVSSKRLGINKLSGVIEWEAFRDVLEEKLGYSRRDMSNGGRPPFDPVFMLKVLVLQKYHGLSDLATEEQISDRLSFMQFLDLEAGDDVPDANTIWDFKETLGAEGVEQIFEQFAKLLDEHGIIGREGSIVDASFVDVPRQRNSRLENEELKRGVCPEGFEKDAVKGRQKDCEARWAVKNKEIHFGYKNHAKVDAKSKLILKYQATAASVHDSQVVEKAVLGDAAYRSEKIEKYLLEQCDCEDFIHAKAQRDAPLSSEEKATNRLLSRVRCRVEHVFGRLAQFGADVMRTIGQERAEFQIGLSNIVYNMDRYAYLMKK